MSELPRRGVELANREAHAATDSLTLFGASSLFEAFSRVLKRSCLSASEDIMREPIMTVQANSYCVLTIT